MSSPFVSIYEPVKITIDGQEYPLRKRTRAVMRQLAQLQSKLQGEASAEDLIDFAYEQIALLVDAPVEVIDGLDEGEVKRLSKWLSTAGRGEPGDAGKNPVRPGDETPPA